MVQSNQSILVIRSIVRVCIWLLFSGPEEEFIVETDTSTLGIGAVLAQKQRDG